MEAPSKNIRGWMGLAATVIATPVGSDLGYAGSISLPKDRIGEKPPTAEWGTGTSLKSSHR